VIGYGNELRGDDGAAPRIARAVAAWGLPEVRALAAHQLTPELAEAVASARYAIFVDAYRTDSVEADISLRPLEPLERPQLAGHAGDPRALLALAAAVYGKYPRACLITVPATCFDFGAALSCVASAAVQDALQLIRSLIASARGELCHDSDRRGR
jgi:hydrogenase maturation protease